MRFRRIPRFHAAYEKLPARVQVQADAAFLLFRDGVEQPPFHPSLRIRKMRGRRSIWEGHITLGYVFTFHIERDPETGETIYVFRNIGKHDIYRSP
jgi:hypothetical protein